MSNDLGYTPMSQLLATKGSEEPQKNTHQVVDRDFNEASWNFITKMLDIEMRFPKGVDIEACLGYNDISGIGVLTPEAISKIREFTKRNKDYEIGVIGCIESVRVGSIDSMHVLDTIVNPYESFMGKMSQNHIPHSVNNVLLGGKSTKIPLFIKTPELGD